MINLYQRLNLPPTASRAEIEAALAQYRSELSTAEIRGVQEWLLVNEVRHRYDAKLRQEQPSFFIPSQKQPAPAAPSTAGTAVITRPNCITPLRPPCWAFCYPLSSAHGCMPLTGANWAMKMLRGRICMWCMARLRSAY